MNTQYVDDLGLVLALARVMPEVRFDALARDHLHFNGGRPEAVAGIKELLVEQRRAYRLTIRGRNYLAYLPRLGEIECKTVIYLDDAEELIRRVVEIANQAAPPKK